MENSLYRSDENKVGLEKITVISLQMSISTNKLLIVIENI